MISSSGPLDRKIRNYKRSYYLQKLLRGTIIWMAICGGALLVMIVLESQLWLSSIGRAALYFSFVGIGLSAAVYWIARPIAQLIFHNRSLSDEDAARYIGSRLPEVRDRLLNYVQLRVAARRSVLAKASMEQRQLYLGRMSFTSAIPWHMLMRYLRYLSVVVLVFLIGWVIDARFITESSERLYHYERVYALPMPFRFILSEEQLRTYAGSSFTLELNVEGDYIPTQVEVVSGGRAISMRAQGGGRFTHRFDHLQKDVSFCFEADGFRSIPYTLEVIHRPALLEAVLDLSFPSYTRIPGRRLRQLGSLDLPEGTQIRWMLSTRSTHEARILLPSEDTLEMKQEEDNVFRATYAFSRSGSYGIELSNEDATSSHPLSYEVSIQQDEPPMLFEEVFADTLLYRLLVVSGYATDDYNVSHIRMRYRVTRGSEARSSVITLPLTQKSRGSASFYLEWVLDSLSLEADDLLSYRVEAFDNDALHGPKATYSKWYYFQLPNAARMHEEVSETSRSSTKGAQSSYQSKQQLQHEIESIQEQLKVKKRLDWRDKKEIKQLIDHQLQLKEQSHQLKEQYKLLEEQTEQLDTLSRSIQEKVKQINQLLEEALDPKTQALYEALRKLLEQQGQVPKIQEALEEIQKQEQLQMKNLARVLSLMKRLSYDLDVKQIEEAIKLLSEEQSTLRRTTEQDTASAESLAQRQEQLEEQFREVQKKINEAQKLEQDLELPTSFPNLKTESQKVQTHQQESKAQLNQGNSSKAAKAQREAEKQLQQMEKKIKEMKSQLQALEVEIDIERMSKILDNLIWLSLREEQLEQSMREDFASYIEQDKVARVQFDIQKGSTATIDSLEAFALRNFMISAQLQSEIERLRHQLEESMHAMRERNPLEARTKQRYVTISLNKLALFVSELLENLEMNPSGEGPSDGKKGMPLPELQQQLIEKAEQLKRSGKTGELLSEELVRMIAEQEMIRRKLEELARDPAHQGSEDQRALRRLIQEMKATEKQLSKKELSEDLINKQRRIKTRLLDFDQATQEDKKDQRRQSRRPSSYEQIIPPELKKYKNSKTEQLKIDEQPLPLNRYYEEEVRKYFKRLDLRANH